MPAQRLVHAAAADERREHVGVLAEVDVVAHALGARNAARRRARWRGSSRTSSRSPRSGRSSRGPRRRWWRPGSAACRCRRRRSCRPRRWSSRPRPRLPAASKPRARPFSQSMTAFVPSVSTRSPTVGQPSELNGADALAEHDRVAARHVVVVERARQVGARARRARAPGGASRERASSERRGRCARGGRPVAEQVLLREQVEVDVVVDGGAEVAAVRAVLEDDRHLVALASRSRPGRLIRIRTRSRRPSPSLSSSVSTKTTSSTACAKSNCGWVWPFSTLSHGGGAGSAAAAGPAVMANTPTRATVSTQRLRSRDSTALLLSGRQLPAARSRHAGAYPGQGKRNVG